MCGIAGIIHRDPSKAVDPWLLGRMCNAIRHRGPDDEGYYCNGPVGIGMRRLSIIDLAAGHQPIANEDKQIWVVLNGEIYNYQELRRSLIARGHAFQTRSDTEVIVHLYEDYGAQCARHLRGMFAFCIWDARRRTLLLARDRIGIKPLYYWEHAGALVFASELKALMVHPDFSPDVDRQAMREFLSFLYVPGPRSIFRDIKKLQPAHVLIWRDGTIFTERYWELRSVPGQGRSEEEWAAGLLSHLQNAVRSHLVSDVPVGAFLSGGIDSSAVVACMSQTPHNGVRTFTVGFETQGRSFDERAYAQHVARHFGTDHVECPVRPDIAALIPQIADCFDEPFADSSALLNYVVSQVTRQYVTVALSGLGGDELCGGYERYRGSMWADRWRRLPAWARHRLVPVFRRLAPDWDGLGVSPDRLRRFLAGIELELIDRYRLFISAFSVEEAGRLLGESGQPADAYDRIAAMVSQGDPVQFMLAIDRRMYLPDDLLTLTDRTSMAHGLEVRVPFLDHHLLEYAATIPSNLLLRNFRLKYLLRRALRPILPPSVLHRRKQGFSLPLGRWCRSTLRPFLHDALHPSRIARVGLVDPGEVHRLVAEHLAGEADHESRLFALIMLHEWGELIRRRTTARAHHTQTT